MANRTRFDLRQRPSHGVTLIELMVVLAVLVILLATAGPAMSNFTAGNQLAAAKSTFTGALALARSEAAMRGRTVIVHARGTPAAGNEFAAGWDIVADDNGDGVASVTDTVLRRFDALPSGVKLSGSADLVYRATGYLSTVADQVYTVCRVNGGSDGYRVTVTASGLADVAAITSCT
jgi:prepilin-type N-terminal cleavage/methylation domain-containing protein